MNSWDAYNELLLNGELERFTKILSRYDLFKQAVDLPGDIVECGVFKGAGVLYWAKLIQIFNPCSRRKVVGFDTFDAFPASTEQDKAFAASLTAEADYRPVGPSYLLDLARKQGLEKRLELVQGDATQTIPDYVRSNPGFRIALLNLDFDIYAPTLAALEHLYDRVVPGGLVVFDEYGLPACSEAAAADEFFRGKGVTFRAIPWNMSPTAYLVKPAS